MVMVDTAVVPVVATDTVAVEGAKGRQIVITREDTV